MNTAQIITLSSLVCSVIILILLISGALLGAKTHGRLHRCFLTAAGSLLLNCLLEILMLMLLLPGTEDAVPSLSVLCIIFLDYAAASVVRVVYYLYVRELISMKIGVSQSSFRAVLSFETVHVLLAAAGYLGIIPPWLHSLNLSMILPALSIAVSTTVALRHARVLKKRELVSFMLYMVIPIICYIAEYMFDWIWLACFGGAVALFIIYVNIQAELGLRIFEQEHELAESRTAIMLSQIQPHFLINTLLNIESLCHMEGAQGAEKVARNFSDYLSRNLQFMTEKKPIPFMTELEHTKQYLSIAQVRFGDKLRVEFDIKESDFTLPALTLQPLAENAVWHGICNRENGGTVTIRSEEKPDCYRVIIADDGVGFDTQKPLKDGRRHIGIENVRSRMEIMCGGHLHIDSRPGAGTEAVLTIPKGEKFEK